jgi:hypothetical protein
MGAKIHYRRQRSLRMEASSNKRKKEKKKKKQLSSMDVFSMTSIKRNTSHHTLSSPQIALKPLVEQKGILADDLKITVVISISQDLTLHLKNKPISKPVSVGIWDLGPAFRQWSQRGQGQG